MTATEAAVDAELRKEILSTIDYWADKLIEVSHALHSEPEVGLAEHRSKEKLTTLLGAAGFKIEHPVGGLETAFIGRSGHGNLVIGLCAEYDALPEIGHGCGHNVNGAATVGAAIALASVAEELGISVKLIGTPAEESIGGKITLLQAGVFDDVAAAMMVHANGADEINGSSYALTMWDVAYTGKAAHAAVAPWRGVNAADAVTLAYQAVALLRQQLPAEHVVSFVIHEAGRAPNVIPATARASVELRARSLGELHGLKDAVGRCLEAGALATGAQLTITPQGGDFAELRQDPFMTEAYVEAMLSLGRVPTDLRGLPRASTDMGNVSQQIPSIQPMIGYDVGGAVHHTPQFTEHGITPSADLAVLDAARALALAGAKIATDPGQRTRLLEHLSRGGRSHEKRERP